MSARLDKIGADRDKARKKRDEWDARFKELDLKYKAQENVEIHDLVHAANMTPDELAELLKGKKRVMSNLKTGSEPEEQEETIYSKKEDYDED